MEPIAAKKTYIGIFLVSFATLMYEILMTRIFSVTLVYHYAFLVVSIALLGMTIGANFVYLFPKNFEDKKTDYWLSLATLLFGLSIIFSFFVQTNVYFSFTNPAGNSLVLLTNFIVTMVPFTFSGICISLAVSKYTKGISKIYASDLIGASLGALFLIIILNKLGAQNAVIFVAATSSLASVIFSNSLKFFRVSLISFLSILLLLILNISLSGKQRGIFKIRYAKGYEQKTPIYEKWNSYSRVTINERENIETVNGVSNKYLQKAILAKKLHMRIDADAYTPLLYFDGNLSTHEYLKHDIANLAHQIKKDANVLIIGSGGGRDVLSALVFDQKRIVGVEINKEINYAVNRIYGDFTGHLDGYPNVEFVNDEARSFIASQKDQYDIIQISLIDTWAATSAGAYVLSENSLYTLDAWNIFLQRLSGNGVLSVTRWYVKSDPLEIYRLTSLATESVRRTGVTEPEKHIVIVDDNNAQNLNSGSVGLATLLLSKSPFSQEDLAKIEEISKEDNFEILLSPKGSMDPIFTKIYKPGSSSEINELLKADVSPPTDEKPFFFNMLRFKDLFNNSLKERKVVNFNMTAVVVLMVALALISAFSLVFIFIPLKINARFVNTRKILPIFMYFASIGFGYMLIEISQMQRLTIFLGHPVYSLTVILFTILLSSGIGSFTTYNLNKKIEISRGGVKKILILLATLLLVGLITPGALHLFQSLPTVGRILISIVLLTPLGFFMGMLFPIGVKMAGYEDKKILPWLWGVNGATSVYASVPAIIIALAAGISYSYWTGFLFYTLSFFTFIWISKETKVGKFK